MTLTTMDLFFSADLTQRCIIEDGKLKDYEGNDSSAQMWHSEQASRGPLEFHSS